MRILVIITALSLLSCTHVQKWGKRGAGALGAFVLHEACHLAVGTALGNKPPKIKGYGDGITPRMIWYDVGDRDARMIAFAGNACTGILAEILMDTGATRKSDLAWGAAAFHGVNAIGYSVTTTGDAEWFQDSGGSGDVWFWVNSLHGTRTIAQLLWGEIYPTELREAQGLGGAESAPSRDWNLSGGPRYRFPLSPLEGILER